MRLHDSHLIWGEHGRLEEDVVRDGNLADIVQRSRAAQGLDVCLREPEGRVVVSQLLREHGGKALHAVDVAGGVAVAVLHDVAEDGAELLVYACELRRLRLELFVLLHDVGRLIVHLALQALARGVELHRVQDAAAQDVGRYGLGEELRGAEVEALGAGLGISVCGDHEDGRGIGDSRAVQRL